MIQYVAGEISGPIADAVRNANARLGTLLEDAHRSIRGEGAFGPEQVRQARVAISKMDPILQKFNELRREDPQLASDLDEYLRILFELQSATQNLKIALLAQQTNLRTARHHNVAVTRWIDALRQTT